ncbi:MAG: flagellar hook-basal body complex protein FliE [Balneolales bacterium]
MAIDPISIQSIREIPFNEVRPESSRFSPDPGDKSFADMIKGAINSVDELQKVSEGGIEDILAGKAENIHEVMIDMQKSQLGFQLMVEVRNRAVETYQELSRMQI